MNKKKTPLTCSSNYIPLSKTELLLPTGIKTSWFSLSKVMRITKTH